MLTDFLLWWLEQMGQLVPARFAARDAAAANALIVEPQPVPGATLRAALTLRRGGRDRKLGRFDLDPAGGRAIQAALRARPALVMLRLPAGLLLDREVVLPLAAEREPARVLEYEMDRITPFSSGEVFWTYAVTRRDRVRGRLHLRLSLVTKASLQPLLAALEQAGIPATMLESVSAEGAARRIDLRRGQAGRGRVMRHAVIALAGLCVVLALAAVAMPFVRQSEASARVETRIAALRPQVDAVEAARRRIAATAAGVDVIAAERLRLGDTLAVLAAVTDLLPDDTSLTDFTLRQGKLTLNGQSAAAAKLIAALSTDPVIRNPDFAAPVTRVDNGRADMFAIRAEVAR